MKNTWLTYLWKAGAVLLILYVTALGLIIPLGAGIDTVEVGEDRLTIHTEQAHFSPSDSIKIWFTNDADVALCIKPFTVEGSNELSIPFSSLQGNADILNTTSLNLVIHSAADGYLYQRRAIETSSFEALFTPVETDAVCQVKTDLNAITGLRFPHREILNESIRNLFFHVPMWFAMLFVLFASFIASIIHLNKATLRSDVWAHCLAQTGLIFGVIGILTGMLWAQYTWGKYWTNDPKLNGAALGLLVYAAYHILRAGIPDNEKRGRIAAVYNIFAFVIYVAFIFVIPRLTDSLHPGNGGNPAFSTYDLDSTLRLFFYPAVIGWTLLAFWISQLFARFEIVKEQLNLKS